MPKSLGEQWDRETRRRYAKTIATLKKKLDYNIEQAQLMKLTSWIKGKSL